MNTRLKGLALAFVLGSFGLGSIGVASASEPIAETELLYISAGCVGTPTCTSTRWLGKTKGTATSNFLTATTPVDEVQYRVDGSINWRDYASDDTLRAGGYPLNAAEQIKATVALSTNGVAINDTVHARIEAVTATNQSITFGPLEQTVTMTPASTANVNFSFDIPDDLEGKVIVSLTAYVAVHGVNVQGGYINQQGGSTVEIPYWAPGTA